MSPTRIARPGGRGSSVCPPYAHPETLAGVGASLRIVFGRKFIGIAKTIDGLLLILFINFLPSGIYGGLRDRLRARPLSAGT